MQIGCVCEPDWLSMESVHIYTGRLRCKLKKGWLHSESTDLESGPSHLPPNFRYFTLPPIFILFWGNPPWNPRTLPSQGHHRHLPTALGMLMSCILRGNWVLFSVSIASSKGWLSSPGSCFWPTDVSLWGFQDSTLKGLEETASSYWCLKRRWWCRTAYTSAEQ